MEDSKNKAQICACPEISEATTEYLSRDLAQLVLVKSWVTRRSFCRIFLIVLFFGQILALDHYSMSNFFNLKARAAAATANSAGSSKAATPPKNSQTLQPWVEK